MARFNDRPTLPIGTSGSTGKPKTIDVQKEHMINSALATGAFFKMGPGTKGLHCLPSNFIAGKMMLIRAMYLGWDLHCIRPTSIPLIPTGNHYDFCAMVPLQLQNSIPALGRIGTLIVGGAPLASELKSRLVGLKTKIYETYGMTETVSHIAVKEITTNAGTESNFKTLPDVVLSKDDRDCLVIRAPKIMGGAMATNDVVELISPSEFIWLGRYDNIINSGGIKLIPEQIEQKLSPILTTRFFVAGIPDAVLGQKLVLVVEGDVDAGQISEEIRTLSSLSKYEIPKEIHGLPKFLETANGKVRREATLQAIRLYGNGLV
ncbi:MAG TPA: AMP-binding protein [Arenibacter sp.]|nr:AMP-binding protein [Arenibacter sp.]